jgi:hypothetical protein
MILIDITKSNIIEAREQHIKSLTPKILKSVSDSDNSGINSFLTEDRIKCILGGLPEELLRLNRLFFQDVIENFKIEDWEAYNDITKINQPEEKRRLRNIFDNIYVEIEDIFDYGKFSKKRNKQYDIYDLAEKLDIPTCPYCNRMYTKTVMGEAGEKIIRPEFDHWFPKSQYPLLALSFYNLIPSCHICNSNLKGNIKPDLKYHFHPYNPINNFHPIFSYELKDYDSYKIKIGFRGEFKEKKEFEKSLKIFELENIYQAHEDEVKDLIKIRQAYSDKYIDMLNDSLKGVNLSKEEVYRLAFGVHYEDDKFDRRPLSKLKKDILTELGII